MSVDDNTTNNNYNILNDPLNINISNSNSYTTDSKDPLGPYHSKIVEIEDIILQN